MQLTTILLSSLTACHLVQNVMAADKKNSSATITNNNSSSKTTSSSHGSSSKSSKKSTGGAVALNEGAFTNILGGAVAGALAFLL